MYGLGWILWDSLVVIACDWDNTTSHLCVVVPCLVEWNGGSWCLLGGQHCLLLECRARNTHCTASSNLQQDARSSQAHLLDLW